MSIIIKSYKPKQVMEGEGVTVNRVFGYRQERELLETFRDLENNRFAKGSMEV
jgi:hypothetical protein